RGPHWPMLAALVAGIAVSAMFGVAAGLMLRRFARMPRAIVTVATIGIAQVVEGTQEYVLRLFHQAQFGFSIPTQVGSTPFDFFAYRIRPADPVVFRGT